MDLIILIQFFFEFIHFFNSSILTNNNFDFNSGTAIDDLILKQKYVLIKNQIHDIVIYRIKKIILILAFINHCI